jgi:hypothetical protein
MMVTDLEFRAKAERLVATWEQNIIFFKERIELQATPNFVTGDYNGGRVMTYNQVNIDLEQDKINKVEALLKEIS